jgi:hypothetical protein
LGGLPLAFGKVDVVPKTCRLKTSMDVQQITPGRRGKYDLNYSMYATPDQESDKESKNILSSSAFRLAEKRYQRHLAQVPKFKWVMGMHAYRLSMVSFYTYIILKHNNHQ